MSLLKNNHDKLEQLFLITLCKVATYCRGLPFATPGPASGRYGGKELWNIRTDVRDPKGSNTGSTPVGLELMSTEAVCAAVLAFGSANRLGVLDPSAI